VTLALSAVSHHEDHKAHEGRHNDGHPYCRAIEPIWVRWLFGAVFEKTMIVSS
jgi:hypothetical protein